MANDHPIDGDVLIPVNSIQLEGELKIPAWATGVVLFAHGSGSSRHSSRNQFVARVMREKGIGTLLFDLLTSEEEAVDIHTRHLRFDIGLLADRLASAASWLADQEESKHLKLGFFGASTGGAASPGRGRKIERQDPCGRFTRRASGLGRRGAARGGVTRFADRRGTRRRRHRAE